MKTKCLERKMPKSSRNKCLRNACPGEPGSDAQLRGLKPGSWGQSEHGALGAWTLPPSSSARYDHLPPGGTLEGCWAEMLSQIPQSLSGHATSFSDTLHIKYSCTICFQPPYTRPFSNINPRSWGSHSGKVQVGAWSPDRPVGKSTGHTGLSITCLMTHY